LARTVLLADDSVTAQNMGRRILMDAGYEVVTVNNGSAALKKIHESRPDLIVLDVYMPGYGGLEVCQRLKDTAETARIPVLLSVGKMEPFKSDEAKRVRADGHIVKPFEASELLAALTKLEDRIVPAADSSSGRRGKSESGTFDLGKSQKRSHRWKGEDPLASADEPVTDRIAYLAEAKRRRVEKEDESGDAGEQAKEVVGTSPEKAKRSAPPAVTSGATAAAPEFVVQEPAVSPESGEPVAHVEAFEPPIKATSIFDSPTVEVPAAQLPMSEVSSAEISARENQADETPSGPTEEALSSQAAADEESFAEQPTPQANAELSLPEALPIVAAPASRVSASRWIAENVALSVEEASIALEAEMLQAQAASTAATRETVASWVSAPEPVASSGEAAAPSAREIDSGDSAGAAFAAAASSSSADAVSGQPSAFGGQPGNLPAEDATETPALQPEVEPSVPSDATAAWANWQQIRDSVMSPQQAEEIAESMAAIAHAGLPAPEPVPASKEKEDVNAKPGSTASDAASTAPAPEDNSINEIVDSVLADLKPRLMQEIAKKLAAKK